jgi:hypothetical protein
MSRVTLGASFLVGILCLPLPGRAIDQPDSSEPGASAADEEYGGEMAAEYGERGSYGIAEQQSDDLFGAPGPAAARENIAAPSVDNPTQADRQGSSAAAHIEAALDEPLKSPLQYEDQPLNEVIDVLQDEYDIPILFDMAALEEVAISPDTEITINLRNVTLRSALNLILQQPGLEDLAYFIDDEVLMITTQERANSKLTIEVYRVNDLT